MRVPNCVKVTFREPWRIKFSCCVDYCGSVVVIVIFVVVFVVVTYHLVPSFLMSKSLSDDQPNFFPRPLPCILLFFR